MNESMYNKYGGFEAVNKIVHCLYEKITVSDILKPYFKNVDMQRLMGHQIKFFSSIMGGPINYDDKQLSIVHSRLNISHEAFVEVAELLEESLEDCAVAQSDIKIVLAIVENIKPLIVQN